jgi:hypothetical protein
MFLKLALYLGFLTVLERFEKSMGKRIFLFIHTITGKERQKNIDQLIQFLMSQEGSRSGGLAGSKIELGELSEYKFYTTLLRNLMAHSKQMGAPIKNTLFQLRKGIITDSQFEKKCQKDISGGLFQVLMISIFTWFFFIFSFATVERSVPLSLAGMILFLQILGLALLIFLSNYLKKRDLRPFNNKFCALYCLQAYHQVGVPYSEAVNRSKIWRAFEKKDRIQKSLGERLIYLMESWRLGASGVKLGIEEVINEVWFQLEEVYLSLLKKISILKFFILVIFFLSAYFLILFNLISFIFLES